MGMETEAAAGAGAEDALSQGDMWRRWRSLKGLNKVFISGIGGGKSNAMQTVDTQKEREREGGQQENGGVFEARSQANIFQNQKLGGVALEMCLMPLYE